MYANQQKKYGLTHESLLLYSRTLSLTTLLQNRPKLQLQYEASIAKKISAKQQMFSRNQSQYEASITVIVALSNNSINEIKASVLFSVL